MNTKRLVVLATLAAFAAMLGTARATPPVNQQTEALARGTTSDTLELRASGTTPARAPHPWRGRWKSDWDVTTLRVTLPPGASTGWHRHPGPGFAVVTQGALTIYSNDCTPSKYNAGQAYVEIPGLLNLVRNDSTTPAQFVVTFVVPSTAPLRMDVAAPPCTPATTKRSLASGLPDDVSVPLRPCNAARAYPKWFQLIAAYYGCNPAITPHFNFAAMWAAPQGTVVGNVATTRRTPRRR